MEVGAEDDEGAMVSRPVRQVWSTPGLGNGAAQSFFQAISQSDRDRMKRSPG